MTMDHAGRQEPRTDTASVRRGDAAPEPIDYGAEIHVQRAGLVQTLCSEMHLRAVGALASRLRIERRNRRPAHWERLNPTVTDAGTQVRVYCSWRTAAGAVSRSRGGGVSVRGGTLRRFA